MEKAVQQAGGFLTLEDLVNDRAEWWEPISIAYRDCEVYTASPPSTAFPSLIRLGIMSQFDVAASEHNSFEMLRHLLFQWTFRIRLNESIGKEFVH